jgi:hypothetical protein
MLFITDLILDQSEKGPVSEFGPQAGESGSFSSEVSFPYFNAGSVTCLPDSFKVDIPKVWSRWLPNKELNRTTIFNCELQ